MSDLLVLEGRGRPPRDDVVEEDPFVSWEISEERVVVKARLEADGASDFEVDLGRGAPYRESDMMVDLRVLTLEVSSRVTDEDGDGERRNRSGDVADDSARTPCRNPSIAAFVFFLFSLEDSRHFLRAVLQH